MELQSKETVENSKYQNSREKTSLLFKAAISITLFLLKRKKIGVRVAKWLDVRITISAMGGRFYKEEVLSRMDLIEVIKTFSISETNYFNKKY